MSVQNKILKCITHEKKIIPFPNSEGNELGTYILPKEYNYKYKSNSQGLPKF